MWLAEDRPVQVVYIEELADQTLLEGSRETSARITSLDRRFRAMSDATGHDIRFTSAMTHDITATIHRFATSLREEWVVLEWGGHSRSGRLLRNPRAWLHRHMPCNLALFHDAGVRRIREIMVYAEPGPDDALVVNTSDHLAEGCGGRLTFVRYVADDADRTEVHPQADYLDQLQQMTRSPSTSKLIRGTDYLTAMEEASATCDLLVMGAPRERGIRALFATDKDHLTEAAACSVLRLQTPHEQFHKTVEQSQPDGGFDLLTHIGPDCLGADLPADTKEALLDALSHRLAGAITGASAAQILEAEDTVLGIFTTATPLQYAAPDGQPIDVCVVTVGPPSERQTHLQLIATISRLILKSGLLPKLRAATDSEAMHQALEASLREMESSE